MNSRTRVRNARVPTLGVVAPLHPRGARPGGLRAFQRGRDRRFLPLPLGEQRPDHDRLEQAAGSSHGPCSAPRAARLPGSRPRSKSVPRIDGSIADRGRSLPSVTGGQARRGPKAFSANAWADRCCRRPDASARAIGEPPPARHGPSLWSRRPFPLPCAFRFLGRRKRLVPSFHRDLSWVRDWTAPRATFFVFPRSIRILSWFLRFGHRLSAFKEGALPTTHCSGGCFLNGPIITSPASRSAETGWKSSVR